MGSRRPPFRRKGRTHTSYSASRSRFTAILAGLRSIGYVLTTIHPAAVSSSNSGATCQRPVAPRRRATRKSPGRSRWSTTLAARSSSPARRTTAASTRSASGSGSAWPVAARRSSRSSYGARTGSDWPQRAKLRRVLVAAASRVHSWSKASVRGRRRRWLAEGWSGGRSAGTWGSRCGSGLTDLLTRGLTGGLTRESVSWPHASAARSLRGGARARGADAGLHLAGPAFRSSVARAHIPGMGTTTTTVTAARVTALAGVDLRALSTDLLGAGHPCPSPAHRGDAAPPPIELSTGERPRWRCPGCGDGGSALDLVSLALGCGTDEAILRLQHWAGGGSETEAGHPMPVDAPPPGVHARPRPFALAVAGEAWREVVVEAEPSATIGDLADALGLDPARGLEVDGDIVDRSRRLTAGGATAGRRAPSGRPSTGGTRATVGRRAPVGHRLRCRAGRPARRRGLGRSAAGPVADAVVSVATSGVVTALDLRTGRLVGTVGGRLDLSVGTAVVSTARTVTRCRVPTALGWTAARRAIAPPPDPRPPAPEPPAPLDVPTRPGSPSLVPVIVSLGRWDRARRRPAAGARAHARRPWRRRHAGHVRMAEVAMVATARSLSSCPRRGLGRASRRQSSTTRPSWPPGRGDAIPTSRWSATAPPDGPTGCGRRGSRPATPWRSPSARRGRAASLRLSS